jgi:hypothetical protein
MTAGAHRSPVPSSGSLRWSRPGVAARGDRAVADTDRPPLAAAERVLVAAADPVAGHVVATTSALYLRERDHTDVAWRRVAWFDVDAVCWDPASGSLTLTTWTTGETWRIGLGARHRSRLVALVHERIAATVLIRRRIDLAGGGVAVVSARRRDGSAPVEWVVVVPGSGPARDPGPQPAPGAATRPAPGSGDDGVRDDILSAIRGLRAEFGI